MKNRGWVWFLGVMLFSSWNLAAGLESAPPDVSDRFTVRHAPVPAMATRYDSTKSGGPMHVWRYRTEIRNDHPFPLRILRFGTEEFTNGAWASADLGGRPFTTADFAEWYTAGAPAVEGWIAPGQTAADSTNWNRSLQPVPPQLRWYYLAVDSAGREYYTAAVPELCPYQPADAPWATMPAAKRVPVRLRVEGPAEAPPAVSQLRFERLSQDVLLPPPAVYTWQGDEVPAIAVGAPGLYLLRFQATGCHPWALPLIVTEDDPGLTLTLRPVRRDAEPPIDEERVEPGAAHAYLNEVWRLQRLSDGVRAAYSRAYAARDAAHDETVEFDYDWSPLTDALDAAMTTAPHEATRRFAAWLACSPRRIADRDVAALVAALLPGRSPLWSTDPEIAVHTAFECGKLLERDLITQLALESPDHFVQAHATAWLAVNAKDAGDENAVTRYRARLDSEFADVKSLAWQRNRIAAERRILVGRPSPPFRVQDLDTGTELTNADFTGRYLLVHFWATWCGFCKLEMPEVHAAVAKYRGRGLEILSLSLDRKLEDVTAYRQGAWKLPWQQALLAGGQQDAVARDFEVDGIPRLVLVGPDGVIVAVGESLRGENLDATLAKWLGQD